MSTIAELIGELAENKILNQQEIYSIQCNVVSTDAALRTCVCAPTNGDAQISGVRLQSITGESPGFTIFPKVDSFVTVTFMNKFTGFVSQYSEIEGYIMESSNESLNDILNDLITQIEQLTVTTTVGPSGFPINLAAFTAIKTRLTNLFKG